MYGASLGQSSAITVASTFTGRQPPASSRSAVFFEQLSTVCPGEARIAGWEIPPDISQGNCSQKSVNNGVNQHIRIAVACQSPLTRQNNTTKHERSAISEAVNVMQPIPERTSTLNMIRDTARSNPRSSADVPLRIDRAQSDASGHFQKHAIRAHKRSRRVATRFGRASKATRALANCRERPVTEGEWQALFQA